MNLEKLLDLTYLFERYPSDGFSLPVKIALLVIFILAIILAIYAHRKIKPSYGASKKLWRKLEAWGWTTGLMGLVFVYLREVQALYLSSRFWLLLFLLIIIIWLLFIFRYWKKGVPNKEEAAKQEKEFDKWLPKRK